jgi:hypothetical protein
MTEHLTRRSAVIERQRNVLVQWSGHCPSDAELAPVIATVTATASTGAP